MKYLIIVLFSLLCINVLAQKSRLDGKIFQNVQEPSIFKYYSNNILKTLWVYKDMERKGISIEVSYYGFADSCNLRDIKMLEKSGFYYFEIDTISYNEGGVKVGNLYNSCATMNFSTEGQDTFMILYYNSSQQYVIYKRIDSLPEMVSSFIQGKGISIDAY